MGPWGRILAVLVGLAALAVGGLYAYQRYVLEADERPVTKPSPTPVPGATSAPLPSLSPIPSPVPGAPPPPEFRHEWSGFPPGSTVTYGTFQKSAKGELSSVLRMTLGKSEGAKFSVKIENLINNEPAGSETKEAEAACEWGVRTGRGKIDVDGRTYDCMIYSRETQAGNATERTQRWVSDKVPGRVVQEETVIYVGSKVIRTSGRLTRLGQTARVGSRTVTYAVWEQTGSNLEGSQLDVLRWITEEIPGFLVKEEKRLLGASKELILQTREATTFEVK